MKLPRIGHRISVVALIALAPACTVRPFAPEAAQTVIVHASRALPGDLPETLDRMRGVRWTRVATSAMVNLVRVDGGRPLPHRAPGSVLPFSIAAAEPLPDPGDTVSSILAAGLAVIPESSARVRGIGAGAVLTIGVGEARESVTVGSVLDDPRTVEVEALVPMAAARRLGVTDVRRIVVAVDESRSRRFRTEAQRLSAPVPVRVGSSDDVATPDAGKLLSLAQIKERLGEFSFVPGTGRWLEPDPRWQTANIVQAELPVVGTMRCHRKVVPALAGLVTEQTSCYAPRVQFGNPRMISRHTWGIAVDINPTGNAFGEKPTQDPRLVAIMARHGFAWGGVWLTPDGMHFEYTGA